MLIHILNMIHMQEPASLTIIIISSHKNQGKETKQSLDCSFRKNFMLLFVIQKYGFQNLKKYWLCLPSSHAPICIHNIHDFMSFLSFVNSNSDELCSCWCFYFVEWINEFKWLMIMLNFDSVYHWIVFFFVS